MTLRGPTESQAKNEEPSPHSRDAGWPARRLASASCSIEAQVSCIDGHHRLPNRDPPHQPILHRLLTDCGGPVSAVANYGLTTGAGPHSCAYLLPVVMSALARLGAVTVLDGGQGNGALSRALTASGFQVGGVEPDPGGVEIATKAAPHVPFYTFSVGDSPDQLLRDLPDGLRRSGLDRGERASVSSTAAPPFRAVGVEIRWRFVAEDPLPRLSLESGT